MRSIACRFFSFNRELDGAYLISGGLNGGSQSILDGILFMVAGALGFTDGATGQHLGKRYSSNLPRLQYLSKLAKVSAGLGFLASFVSIYQAFTNDSLSLSQKLVRHQQLF